MLGLLLCVRVNGSMGCAACRLGCKGVLGARPTLVHELLQWCGSCVQKLSYQLSASVQLNGPCV